MIGVIYFIVKISYDTLKFHCQCTLKFILHPQQRRHKYRHSATHLWRVEFWSSAGVRRTRKEDDPLGTELSKHYTDF